MGVWVCVWQCASGIDRSPSINARLRRRRGCARRCRSRKLCGLRRLRLRSDCTRYIRIYLAVTCRYVLPASRLIYLRIILFGFTRRMTICKYVFNWFVIIIVAVLIVFAIVPAIVFLLLLQLYSHIYSYEAISVYSPTILLFV